MKTKITEKIYRLNDRVAVEYFDDGALILNLKDHHFCELNCTARDALKKTDGQRSISQIAQLVATDYETPLSEVLQDIIELFDQLLDQNIVKQIKV
jgi:hypothetical protein